MSLPFMWVTASQFRSPAGVMWGQEKVPPKNLFQRYRAVVGPRVYWIEVTHRGRTFLVFKGGPIGEYPDVKTAMEVVDLKVVTAKLKGKL